MRFFIFTLAVLGIVFVPYAFCADDDAGSSGSKNSENSRIYDNKGNFRGRTVGSGNNIRVYDNQGNFVGRIIQDKNASSARIYDNKGNFKGRINR